MTIIRAENLCKTYKTHERGSSFAEAAKSLFSRKKVFVKAVDDISFDISKGEIVGILGPNGAGKSTTIKMLTGILLPTSGTVEVLGYNPIKSRTKYVRQIGAVFGQKSQLVWDIPPLDSFYMNKAIFGLNTNEYKTTLDRLSTLLKVEEVMKRPARVLSLGERMKCEFIMAMLHSPSVVFLDEPTIGLDMIAKDNIRDFICEMNASGVTFILTTHDLNDVEKLAHRVIIINEGKKVYEDSIAMLMKHLGNKKIIYLKTRSALDLSKLICEGISAELTENKYKLLVDNDIIPMDEFIKRLTGICSIEDLSIHEQEIGEIVKSIYKL